jgi:hypothetical protein
MKSAITTSKSVIPNIQHQTHKLAVFSKVTQRALQLQGRGKKKNRWIGYDAVHAGSLVYSTHEDGFHAVVT